MSNEEPVVLELAPLPRDQMGPFLILGLDKDAGPEQIEAHWAQRVILARKGQISVPLHDINWAREVLGDVDRRVRADAASLNTDTLDRALTDVAARFGIEERAGPAWLPLDVEKPLDDYMPPADVPDADELLRSIVVPDVPFDIPAALRLLEEFAKEPVDPWGIRLPGE